MQSEPVKPFTDEEFLQALDDIDAWDAKIAATMKEDRRKLALAKEKLRRISNYCEFGSVSKSLADEALVELDALTTTNPPSDAE